MKLLSLFSCPPPPARARDGEEVVCTETDFLFPELTPLRASYPQLLRGEGGVSQVAPEARGRLWHSFLLGSSTLLL